MLNGSPFLYLTHKKKSLPFVVVINLSSQTHFCKKQNFIFYVNVFSISSPHPTGWEV